MKKPMNATEREMPGWGRWLLAAVGAVVFALLIAAQNYFAFARAQEPYSFWVLFRGELPVWFSWLAAVPAIGWLLERYPPLGGRRPAVNLLVHIAASLVGGVVTVTLTMVVRSIIARPIMPEGMTVLTAIRIGFANSFSLFLLVYAILAGALLAFRFFRDSRRRELRESQLITELTQARLDTLRSQLQPHFLFNTLHAISALMAEDVVAARKMMRRLSELLRLTLEEGPDEVPLDEELHFLRQYLEIQEIRFGDALRVEYDIDPEALRLGVPRLLLQPLAENAIKHGTERGTMPGVVAISANRVDQRLRLCVMDNGPGFSAPATAPSFGVGLRHTRSRLEHVYGADYQLTCDTAPAGGGRVLVDLPARNH